MESFSKEIKSVISKIKKINNTQHDSQHTKTVKNILCNLKILETEIKKLTYTLDGKSYAHHIKNDGWFNDNILAKQILQANATRDTLEDYYSITETLVFNHFTLISKYDQYSSIYKNGTNKIIDNEGNIHNLKNKEEIQHIANKYNLTFDQFSENLYELMDSIANS